MSILTTTVISVVNSDMHNGMDARQGCELSTDLFSFYYHHIIPGNTHCSYRQLLMNYSDIRPTAIREVNTAS